MTHSLTDPLTGSGSAHARDVGALRHMLLQQHICCCIDDGHQHCQQNQHQHYAMWVTLFLELHWSFVTDLASWQLHILAKMSKILRCMRWESGNRAKKKYSEERHQKSQAGGWLETLQWREPSYALARPARPPEHGGQKSRTSRSSSSLSSTSRSASGSALWSACALCRAAEHGAWRGKAEQEETREQNRKSKLQVERESGGRWKKTIKIVKMWKSGKSRNEQHSTRRHASIHPSIQYM